MPGEGHLTFVRARKERRPLQVAWVNRGTVDIRGLQIDRFEKKIAVVVSGQETEEWNGGESSLGESLT